ncbi:MAG: hypothetical protein VXZ82_17165 [Planctomycetota bacterium]|nr:hypothetical protein [Planctomycetota bacterium]
MKRRFYTLRSLILLTTFLGLLPGLVAVPTPPCIALLNHSKLKARGEVYLNVLLQNRNDSPMQTRNFNTPRFLVPNLHVVEARQRTPAEVKFQASAIFKRRLGTAGDSNLAVLGD